MACRLHWISFGRSNSTGSRRCSPCPPDAVVLRRSCALRSPVSSLVLSSPSTCARPYFHLGVNSGDEAAPLFDALWTRRTLYTGNKPKCNLLYRSTKTRMISVLASVVTTAERLHRSPAARVELHPWETLETRLLLCIKETEEEFELQNQQDHQKLHHATSVSFEKLLKHQAEKIFRATRPGPRATPIEPPNETTTSSGDFVCSVNHSHFHTPSSTPFDVANDDVYSKTSLFDPKVAKPEVLKWLRREPPSASGLSSSAGRGRTSCTATTSTDSTSYFPDYQELLQATSASSRPAATASAATRIATYTSLVQEFDRFSLHRALVTALAWRCRERFQVAARSSLADRAGGEAEVQRVVGATTTAGAGAGTPACDVEKQVLNHLEEQLKLWLDVISDATKALMLDIRASTGEGRFSGGKDKLSSAAPTGVTADSPPGFGEEGKNPREHDQPVLVHRDVVVLGSEVDLLSCDVLLMRAIAFDKLGQFCRKFPPACSHDNKKMNYTTTRRNALQDLGLREHLLAQKSFSHTPNAATTSSSTTAVPQEQLRTTTVKPLHRSSFITAGEAQLSNGTRGNESECWSGVAAPAAHDPDEAHKVLTGTDKNSVPLGTTDFFYYNTKDKINVNTSGTASRACTSSSSSLVNTTAWGKSDTRTASKLHRFLDCRGRHDKHDAADYKRGRNHFLARCPRAMGREVQRRLMRLPDGKDLHVGHRWVESVV
ncbi:unnamed protein product [Amoebophrya sp. A120]|nr:unnamed protein product [Amoebophrya sp. A120]|eukprot:GSA120T00020494001.1